jgi:hypothetical protein
MEDALKVDITLDTDTREITFIQVNNGTTYFIGDEIGLIRGVETCMSLFFINKGMIVELLRGSFVVRENGKLTRILSSGKFEEYEGNERDVYWLDHKDYFRHNLSLTIQNKFNLKNSQVDDYVDNLAYTVLLRNESTTRDISVYCRYLNFMGALGVDFEFETYKDSCIGIPVYLNKLLESWGYEPTDNVNMEMFSKRSAKASLGEYDDDEEEEDEDDEDLYDDED